jgi:PKHD-type hydroxylase
MSIYNFAPFADESGKETHYAYWENGFSESEISDIIKVGESKIIAPAVVGHDEQGKEVPEIRTSKVSWLGYNDIPWLYDRMSFIARKLNGQYFQFDLTGFNEDFQYTVYNGENAGHYDWHVDKGYTTSGFPPRKLSLVLTLSDPEEYEGGDLMLHGDNGIETVKPGKGIVHAFPSYVLHKVTPVAKGTRRTIVVWISGPKFK